MLQLFKTGGTVHNCKGLGVRVPVPEQRKVSSERIGASVDNVCVEIWTLPEARTLSRPGAGGPGGTSYTGEISGATGLEEP